MIKRLLIVLAALVAIRIPVYAQTYSLLIAEISEATTGVTNTATFSHIVASTHTHPALIAFAYGFDNVTPSDAVTSGITWNGSENFIQIGSNNDGAAGHAPSVWYLANPTSGTHNIVQTYGGTPVAYGLRVLTLDNVSVFGVTASGTASPTSTTSPSITLTTVQDNSTMFNVGVTIGGSGVNTAGQTQFGSNGGGFVLTSYATTPKTPAGTVTQTYTQTSGNALMIGAVVSPYSDISLYINGPFL